MNTDGTYDHDDLFRATKRLRYNLVRAVNELSTMIDCLRLGLELHPQHVEFIVDHIDTLNQMAQQLLDESGVSAVIKAIESGGTDDEAQGDQFQQADRQPD